MSNLLCLLFGHDFPFYTALSNEILDEKNDIRCLRCGKWYDKKLEVIDKTKKYRADNKKLDKTLRGFTVDKLHALKSIVDSPTPIVSSGHVGGTVGYEGFALGGIVSSLSRTKIEDEPLVKVVAMGDNRQSLLKYNENIATKPVMKKAINNILEDLR